MAKSVFNKEKDFKKTLYIPIEGVLGPEDVTQEHVRDILCARGIEVELDQDSDIVGTLNEVAFVISKTYKTYPALAISAFWYLRETAPFLVALDTANHINDSVVFVRAQVLNESKESERLCLRLDASCALDGGITEDRIEAFVRRFVATAHTAITKCDSEGIIA